MKYYILYNGENRGPLEIEELEEYGLCATSRVWAPGMLSWQNAGDIPELQSYMEKKEAQAAKARAEAKAAKEAQQKAEEEARMQASRAAQQASQAASRASSNASARATNAGKDFSQHTSPQSKPVEWFMDINNSAIGPLDINELPGRGLTPDTLVWHEGMQNWSKASLVAELAYILNSHAGSVNPGYDDDMQTVQEQQQHFDSIKMPENPKSYGIIAAVFSVAALVIAFLNGEYYDAAEKIKLLAFCGAPGLILAIGSLYLSSSTAKASSLGLTGDAVKKAGIAIGLGIGGIVAAIPGIIFALLTFEVI